MLHGIYLQLGLPILFTTAHNLSEPIVDIPNDPGQDGVLVRPSAYVL